MADTKLGIALSVSGASQAQRDLTLVESSLNRLQTFASGAGKLLGGLAGGLVVREIVQGFNKIVSGMEEIYDTSQKIGVSAEALSGLKYAAQQSGVGFEQLSNGLVKFSKAIAEARAGSKEYAETIAQIGIAAGDNAEQALAKVADVFQRMPNGIEKTALAVKLFGRAGADLIPFLNEGSDGLARLREEAAQLGVVIDDEAARAADEFSDNLDRLGAAAEGAGIALTSSMLAALVDVTNAMAIAARQGEGFIGVLSALATSVERLMYFGSGIGGVDSALAEAEAKLRDMEGLADQYRRIRDGLETESTVSSIRRTVTGTSITEQIETVEAEAAKARTVVAELRGELADYTIAEERAAQIEAKRNKQLAITVTATEKKAEATKKAAGSSKSLADAEAKHATEVERTLQALQLQYVELTQGERARYEMELATKGWSEAEREAALALYDQNEALEQSQKAMKETAEEADVLGTVVKRAAERMTDSFSDFFYDLLTNSKEAFNDFAETVKNMFLRLLADLLAAAMANPIRIILGLTGAGAAGTASAGSSLFGSIGSSLIGNAFSAAFGGGFEALGAGLMGGNLFGTVGNLLSFGAAGLSSGTMAGFMGGLGAIGSVALPVIGVLGAIGALSGMFEDAPDNEWFRMYSGTRGSHDAMAPLASAIGPFGAFGVSGNNDLRGENEGPFSQQLVQTVAQLDAQIAQYMSPAQIARITKGISGKFWHSQMWEEGESSDQAVAQVLKARYVEMFKQVDGAIAKYVKEAADTTEAVGTAVVIGSLKLGIKGWTKKQPVATADLSAQEQLAANAKEIRALASGLADTVEAHENLLQVLQQRYELEVAYLNQINAIGKSISDSFANLYEQIFLTGKSPQETYDYWKQQVNDTLLPQLAAESDPEKIAELVAKIQQMTGTAWNTLGADPAEQLARKQEFLDFLNNTESIAQTRLTLAKADARDDFRELRSTLFVTSKTFGTAAKKLDDVATKLDLSAESLAKVTQLFQRYA